MKFKCSDCGVIITEKHNCDICGNILCEDCWVTEGLCEDCIDLDENEEY